MLSLSKHAGKGLYTPLRQAQGNTPSYNLELYLTHYFNTGNLP
jgi:hypothetical protein